LPVAAKIALSTAGAAQLIAGSPMPPQNPPDGMTMVSTFGISAMRITLCARAYNSATPLTFFFPRTGSSTSPRFLACAFTHSAVAARSLYNVLASSVAIRSRQSPTA